MRRIVSIAVVSCLTALVAACTVPGAEEGEVGTADQEVKKADPLFASICRACHCSMVTRTIDNCQVTRCECDTTKQAECVVNSPGSASLEPVVVPPPWHVPVNPLPIMTASP